MFWGQPRHYTLHNASRGLSAIAEHFVVFVVSVECLSVMVLVLEPTILFNVTL